MKKNKVVIVDDNVNNLLLEKDLMEVAGFEVYEAVNATDGIAMIIKESPDVIIMDIRLPDMSGLEAILILRQNEEIRNIPVVFVTASVLAIEKQALVDVPNSGFISKPINTRTFAKEVGDLIK